MGKVKNDQEEKPKKTGGISTDILLSTKERYDELKQKVADAAMKVASHLKTFENIGGNNKAFKLACWVAAQEKAKGQDFLRTFHRYLVELGVYAQMDMLDEVPDIRAAPAKTANRPAPVAPLVPAGASAH